MYRAMSCILPILAAVGAQQVPQDPGRSGPEPELVHLYYDEWPTGWFLEQKYVSLLMVARNHRLELRTTLL
jgi:hypothetical protein